MSAKRSLTDRTSRAFKGIESFVRDYTDGLETRELRKLFDREASEAYRVLTRDQKAEQKTGFAGFFEKARVLFLGLSYKLSPPRRLLFAVAMILALLGGLGPRLDWAEGGTQVSVQFSPLFFLLSIGALTFLLALELVDRVLFRDELEVARELQKSLLPSTTPTIPDFHVADAYRTANAVGGDYYDVLALDDGRYALVVGDASGHGIAAGLLMAIVHATLRTAVDLDPAPAAVLGVVNRTLCRTAGRRAFMSLFFGLLEPATGELVYASAGHPFPLLRRSDGTLVELGEGGLPLGLRSQLEIGEKGVRLERGDLLVLYSDGLPEALTASGSSFGFDRVRDLVAPGGSPEEVRDRLLQQLRAFLGEAPLHDDLSLLLVSRRQPSPDLPPLPRSAGEGP